MALELAFIPILILALLIGLALFIAVAVEILRSKNDLTWKILWILVSFFLGILGIILYLLVGRKDLQGEKINAIKWLLILAVVLVVILLILLVLGIVFYAGVSYGPA